MSDTTDDMEAWSWPCWDDEDDHSPEVSRLRKALSLATSQRNMYIRLWAGEKAEDIIRENDRILRKQK